MMNGLENPLPQMLVVIADVEPSRKVVDLFHSAHIHLNYQFRGEGTASSELLDCLGLGTPVKAITLCLAPRVVVQRLLDELDRKLDLGRRGHGIAFSLPLAGVSNPIMKMLTEEAREKIKTYIESEVEKVKSNATHSLVLAAINQGHSEELMQAARGAGATGGTVMHARNLGGEQAMQLWGISVQEEKEIVAIIAPLDKKIEIMKAVNAKCGPATEARGLVFSLPVDSVFGLGER